MGSNPTLTAICFKALRLLARAAGQNNISADAARTENRIDLTNGANFGTSYGTNFIAASSAIIPTRVVPGRVRSTLQLLRVAGVAEGPELRTACDSSADGDVPP